MALPPNNHRVDQREEGHDAISSAASLSMTARRPGPAKPEGEQIEKPAL
jgi:hypothetical protein